MTKVLSYFDLIPGMKYTEFCYFHNRGIPNCIETLTVIEPRFGSWHKVWFWGCKGLRYQCTPKLTILPNFSYWYFQIHLIEFFQLQKVLRKNVSPRQSYKEKTILWINYLNLEAVNKLSWSIKMPLPCDYSNQGHPTKFSTNLTNKNHGG